MPANKSTHKVRVTRLFGTDATVGLTDPVKDMKVRVGTDDRWIVALDSGNYQVSLAKASGDVVVQKAYPEDLACDTGVAGYFGWPNGGGDVTFKHENPAFAGTPDNKVGEYLKGDSGPTSFTR